MFTSEFKTNNETIKNLKKKCFFSYFIQIHELSAPTQVWSMYEHSHAGIQAYVNNKR